MFIFNDNFQIEKITKMSNKTIVKREGGVGVV